MPIKTPKRTQIAFRLDNEIFERLDRIAVKLSRPGMMPSRTDILRMVLLAGLPVVEIREGIVKERRTRPRR